MREIVQWKNPALSALVLLLGAFCALAGEFVLRGDHSVTPLKGEHDLSYLCRLLSLWLRRRAGISSTPQPACVSGTYSPCSR